MNEDLSRLVAGIIARAKAVEDPSTGISRIRTSIKNVIEGKDTIFGKFHALVESLREVIPEEKQRYQAAIKALSTTSKLSRQDIVTAINNQLEELKILEKLLISSLPRGPVELKAMEDKSQKIKSEISTLREKIARLEKEEKEIADSMAGWEKETAVIEKALQDVFRDFGAEIISFKNKVEDLNVESAARQPIMDMENKAEFAGKKQSAGGKAVPEQISSRDSIKPQKNCPMCGGQMTISLARRMWHCFSCAHEEFAKEEVQNRALSETIFPDTTTASDLEQNGEKSEQRSPPQPTPSDLKQKCPMCGGRMDYYAADRKWQCYSCGFEQSEKNEAQSKNGGLSADSIFPDLTPASEQKENGEKGEQRTTPDPAPESDLKQKCPMCGGRMDYYAADRKWQCYSCGFEFNTDEAHGNSEENSDHSSTLLAIPAADPISSISSTSRRPPGFWASKKSSSSAKKTPVIIKTCPSCRKKMQSNGSDGWQCPDCGYERTI